MSIEPLGVSELEKRALAELSRENVWIIKDGLRAVDRCIECVQRLELFRKLLLGHENSVIAHGEIALRIVELCNSLGLASTLLFKKVDSWEKEPQQKAFRSARIDFIASLLPENGFTIFQSIAIRDRIVHAETHIARLAQNHPDSGWVLNAGIRSADICRARSGGKVLFSRTYEAEGHRILHLEVELDLEQLVKESAELLKMISIPYGEAALDSLIFDEEVAILK